MLTALIALLLGCASSDKLPYIMHNGHKIQKEFVPYIMKFEKECGCDVKGDVRFGDTGAYIGFCFRNRGSVRISREYWDRTPNQYAREVLIYHELGHCVLNRNHTLEMTGDRYKSIMFPMMFGNIKNYTHNRDEYMIEFFGPKWLKHGPRPFFDRR